MARRRTAKIVYDWNTGTSAWNATATVPWDPNAGGGAWDPNNPTALTKLIHDGWRPIMELDGLNKRGAGVPPAIRKYTWGLDLAGQSGGQASSYHVGPVSNRSSLVGPVSNRSGLGGIGGLLATLDTQGTATTADDKTYLYCYDALGNVGQVVEYATPAFTWSLAANYRYSPYGTVLHSDGAYADTNPFRFSTKWHDDETGLVYYGYRYYLPWLGRWLTTDPIGELDASNLYLFVHNAPLSESDLLGLMGCCDYCGPDITDALKTMRSTIEDQFDGMTTKQKTSVCEAVYSAGGWDITHLGAPTIKPVGKCPSESCAGTVTVDGRCFKATEVNYYLWGLVNRQCGNSLSMAVNTVTLWKWWRYNAYRPGALMWTGRGYFGDPVPARVLGILECDPCSQKTGETLRGHYGGMTFPPPAPPAPPARPHPIR